MTARGWEVTSNEDISGGWGQLGMSGQVVLGGTTEGWGIDGDGEKRMERRGMGAAGG